MTESLTFTYTFSAEQQCTLITALTLAAFHYDDPSLVLDALGVVAPSSVKVVRSALAKEQALSTKEHGS